MPLWKRICATIPTSGEAVGARNRRKSKSRLGGVKVRQGVKTGQGKGTRRMVDEGIKDEEEISIQIGRARV